jgi:hypothetical protein
LSTTGWVSREQLGFAKNRMVSVMDCPLKQGSMRVQIVSNKRFLTTEARRHRAKKG